MSMQNQPTSRRTASGAKPIVVVTAIVGGIALLGTGGTAAAAVVGDLSRSDSVQRIDTSGVEGVDVNVSASHVIVRFGDVREAELTVTGGRGAWTLDREEDDLIVRSPARIFGWWFGSWWGEDERAVLTLPESLRGQAIDGDFELGAGRLDVSGDFGDLDLEVGAGAVSVEGTARSVDADLSAGRAELELDGVAESELRVAAGEMIAEFTGQAPDDVVIDVSAGSLELTLPDERYDVRQDVSAGSLNVDVQTASDARHRISATVSAGSVSLRPGS